MAGRAMRNRNERPDYRQNREYNGNSLRTEQRRRRRELQGHANAVVQQNPPPPTSYRLVSHFKSGTQNHRIFSATNRHLRKRPIASTPVLLTK